MIIGSKCTVEVLYVLGDLCCVLCTCVHASMSTCVCVRACVRVCVRVCVRACVRASLRAYLRAYICVCCASVVCALCVWGNECCVCVCVAICGEWGSGSAWMVLSLH